MKPIHKISSAVIVVVISLASLAGCVYPTTAVPGLTTVPVTYGGHPSLPTKTTDPSPSISSQPTFFSGSQTAPTGSTQSSNPTPTPTPLAKQPANYYLDAILDYAQHTLAIMETITYTNFTAFPLDDLVLIIEPNLVPGGFNLTSIAWSNGNNIDQYTLDENQLKFSLLKPLPPGEHLVLKLAYQLNIPPLADASGSGRPAAYGYTDLQTNIVDWYPYVPPYINGKGWLVHEPWALGEYQVYEAADFTVTISLAEPVPNLVIAASAPVVMQADHYSYHLEAARSFALSASTEYLLQSARIGGYTINSYSFSYDKSAALEALHTAGSAVQVYSKLILPYPYSTLSVVEADFLDGMEYDGLFFLGHSFYEYYDGTPQGYLTTIAAHETAHQWWYGLVGNDQAIEPWLDESLCTFMELVYYESKYSDTQSQSDAPLVNWWWDFRIRWSYPQGYINSTIYDFYQFGPYRNAVYLNGVNFLDDLRNMLGDEVFFTFLQDYAKTNAHAIATADDFFTLLRNETDNDIEPIINTYFSSNP